MDMFLRVCYCEGNLPEEIDFTVHDLLSNTQHGGAVWDRLLLRNKKPLKEDAAVPIAEYIVALHALQKTASPPVLIGISRGQLL